MPGLIILRPVATASKTTRNNPSKLSEKIDEERERVARPLPQFRTSRVHPINMPVFRPYNQAISHLRRSKQVTDPLPENVRARLVGSGVEGERVNYSSSGSEHEPSSLCLAAMVHEFMEEDEVAKCGRARCNCESGSCNGGGCASTEDDDTKSSLGGELSEILQDLTLSVSPQETTLLAEVLKAINSVREEAGEEKCNSGCLKRSVMTQLRAAGYDAALCKSRWDHAGGLPGGDYEYIDVLLEGLNGMKERVMVDTDFQAQFEIARPTARFNALVQAFPSVYVGKADRLQQIVNILSDAIKRSLKKKGMFLPPWRKLEYMRAKWFSCYRRTTNISSQDKKPHPDPVQDIASIAVRRKGWHTKFTNQMELEYERVAPRQVMREMQNEIELSRTIKVVPTEAVEEEETEGVVHGANMLKSLWRDAQNDCDTLESNNMDWQPPALLPRVSSRPGAGTGLATILREAGLTAQGQKNKIVEEIKEDSLLVTVI